MSYLSRKIIALGCSALILLGMINVQEVAYAADSDIASHIAEVTEADKTYEGFLANDEMLSYEELITMPETSVYSEYDTLEELKEMTAAQLASLGVDTADIHDIQTKSVKEIVLENAATLSAEELQEKGLSEDVINSIQNGDYDAVSVSEAEAVSSKLAFSIASCSRSGNVCNYSIYWHWSSEPAVKISDNIGATISHNYWMKSNCTAKIGYAKKGSLTSVAQYRIDPKSASGAACQFEIPMMRDNLWCQAGKAFVSTQGTTSPSGALIAHAEYYHKWTNADISMGINIGKIGISWSGAKGSVEGDTTVHIS